MHTPFAQVVSDASGDEKNTFYLSIGFLNTQSSFTSFTTQMIFIHRIYVILFHLLAPEPICKSLSLEL